jgi:hypothetical protein
MEVPVGLVPTSSRTQTTLAKHVEFPQSIGELTIGLNKRTKSIEEPPMTVELLFVLLLQAENDLHRARSLRNFTIFGNNNTGRISRREPRQHGKQDEENKTLLEDVGSNVFSRHRVLRNAFLKAAHLTGVCVRSYKSKRKM